MPNLKSLAKDTAIYGLSSIVGRFLNYLLVPLYTHYMPKDSGDYGISTNIYAYTALIMVLLTFGMETTLFRFANDERSKPDTVFSTAFTVVGTLTALFLLGMFLFISPIAQPLGYAAHHDYLLMMAVVVALDAVQALPFSYLRFQKRAIRFASLKMLFILLSIGLNVFCFVVLGKTSVFYVFFINLLCTAFITLFFIPDLCRIQWHFDGQLLKRMLSYSWPILILGIAGILNQVADKIVFPLVYPDKAEANVQLGIYGSCVKIAMIMAMITQAFRYAYEPIVFAKSKDGDKNEYYAAAMKYFIMFTLLAFLCVVGWLPVLQYIIGTDYREGLSVVPIVMVAEIMMGIYFNLSFWYKLKDKTIYGAWFSLIGCAVLFAVNIVFIPTYGYMACAWGGVAGYGTAMVLSYVVGQRQNPIPYPMGEIFLYIAAATLCYVLMLLCQDSLPLWASLTINTLLIILFTAFAAKDIIKKFRMKHQAMCIMAMLCLLTACQNNKKTITETETETAVEVIFSEDSAYLFCQKQCDFGPRIMNSEAHDLCGKWIVSQFQQYGLQVTEQQATVEGYDGTPLKCTNIIASYLPEQKERILICAHWDSRPWADNDPNENNWHTPVMAANDGASGVGVMLEIARLLAMPQDTAKATQNTHPSIGIDFICFDAEDWGTPQWAEKQGGSDTWALGAQYWSAYPHTDGYTARYGILLDMVGGIGSRFYHEGYSRYYASTVVDRVWKAAQVAGYSSFFPQQDGGTITDDHVPVNVVAGIPCIDIIPYYPDCMESSFGPTWHTVNDDMQHLDRNTLKAVGQTIVQVLFSEQ